MTRFIHTRNMSADQLVQCSSDARALLHLCDNAAWAIQNNSGPIDVLSDSIGVAVRLALELLAPVHDTLEAQGRLAGGAS